MLSSLKIGQRLSLAFGLLLALLGAMAALAAFQMSRLADNSTYYAVNLVPSYEAQHTIALALGDARRFEARHILAEETGEMDKMEGLIAERQKTVLAQIDLYEKSLLSDDQDRQLLNETRKAVAAYFESWQTLQALSRKTASDVSKQKDATAYLAGASAKAYEAAHAAVGRWWDYNLKLSNQQAETAKSTYSEARIALIAMVVAAFALGIAAAVLITRSIVRPVRRAVEVAAVVAEGDLSGRIEAEGRDEMAELMRSLGQMNDNLCRIVGQVRASSDSIATGSSQIATGNADLSQRTEEQASNLQQTAASMEQLSSTVKQNAETAQEANRMASSAAAAATRGGEMVGNVVHTMQEISHSSKRIAEIIGVIDGIAFQTNILALNAAVEAARAGEQGRGFAVVAGEVRNLASRSAEAAKEIKSLIGTSVEKVETGARQVDEAGESMTAIVAEVKRVSQLIGEITNATVEQSSGISQVGDAVGQLDQVTQQNAALVEESAAAAESLRVQAARLTELVGVFRLDASSAAVTSAATSTATSTAAPRSATPVRTPPPVVPAASRRKAAPAAAPAERVPAPAGADDWTSF
ncbi:methyl-accepting chemotaxis protein [Rubrivivax gelatinosus]|uniref:methyl-accepting chemotaxis protein n=2 Tax=Rubrivivax gelatinosus TaxID=28068 RepID=UPI001A344AD1|nr:methyl-accepting chemotaxis protein [Rubrivivax gelatinosus]MBG6081696.1 methyl-accepting chemotaxis protein [Rubrivivax gelatinosus]